MVGDKVKRVDGRWRSPVTRASKLRSFSTAGIETWDHTTPGTSPFHSPGPLQNFYPARVVSAKISSLLKSRFCISSRVSIVNCKRRVLHQETSAAH